MEAQTRRLTWLLFFGQSLSSAASIAGSTVGAIAGAALSGSIALGGLPAAMFGLGNAATAYPAARIMERLGRRRGLMMGYALGVLGALLAGFAVYAGQLLPFLGGFAGMGAARGFIDLARYAAAEMHPAESRARAMSWVVLGSTIGAIAGPALVAPTGGLAVGLHAPALAGPWFASALLFLIGFIMIGLLLRPDPSELARHFAPAVAPGAPVNARPMRPVRAILGQPATQVAILAMLVGQLVMVMVMAMTSLYMTHNGHGLGDVSIVIMAHTLGMYGLSMVSGRLADNLGRPQTIIAGAVLLAAGCILAPLSQLTGVLAVALFLLGLGWNFCYVAGGALLTDTLTLVERGRMQGGTDLTIALVSAAGSLESGILLNWVGYANLGWISVAIAMLPLLLSLQFLVRRAGRPFLVTTE
ncbi:MAG: MFS transporter [Anaerolineales bacterium]